MIISEFCEYKIKNLKSWEKCYILKILDLIKINNSTISKMAKEYVSIRNIGLKKNQ